MIINPKIIKNNEKCIIDNTSGIFELDFLIYEKNNKKINYKVGNNDFH
jgi:hypothetical protein